jgi:hypothetical protein
VRGDGGAVLDQQLRRKRLLRERELQRLRVPRRDLRDDLFERRELRDGVLLQHHEPTVRAERDQWHCVRGDSGAMHERLLRGERLLLHRDVSEQLQLFHRDVRDELHDRCELRGGHLLQHDVASVRAERGERQRVRGDGGAVLERQVRRKRLLRERDVREQFRVHGGKRDV